MAQLPEEYPLTPLYETTRSSHKPKQGDPMTEPSMTRRRPAHGRYRTQAGKTLARRGQLSGPAWTPPQPPSPNDRGRPRARASKSPPCWYWLPSAPGTLFLLHPLHHFAQVDSLRGCRPPQHEATVRICARPGVEMEALTAVSVALDRLRKTCASGCSCYGPSSASGWRKARGRERHVSPRRLTRTAACLRLLTLKLQKRKGAMMNPLPRRRPRPAPLSLTDKIAGDLERVERIRGESLSRLASSVARSSIRQAPSRKRLRPVLPPAGPPGCGAVMPAPHHILAP